MMAIASSSRAGSNASSEGAGVSIDWRKAFARAARVRYTDECPCPTCGGHAGQARGQGQRCHGYWLGSTPYCSRIESDRPAPSGDLWAHRVGRNTSAARPPSSSDSRAPRSSKPWTRHHEHYVVAFHPYGGPDPFEVARFDEEWRERGYPKTMPRHQDEHGKWWTGIPPAMRSMTDAPLYGPDEAVLALAAGEGLYIPEGESCVDAIREAGGIACCNPCGAGKWKPHHTAAIASVVSNSPIRIVRDRDPEGSAHAARVYSALW